MRGILATVTASLAMAVVSQFAQAHHATSAFDRQNSVTVEGTVNRWQFINPHSGIWIDVESDGAVEEWVGEFQGTLDLYRHFSWNKDTFHPGDRVTLTGYPAFDGSNAMSVRIVKFADGSEVDVRSAPD